MTQIGLEINDTDREALRALKDAEEDITQALADALYETGQVMQDEWRAVIWEDTGDAKESGFVSRPATPDEELVTGFVAPYVQIVEETHPERPHLLARTYGASLLKLAQTLQNTAERLVEDPNALPIEPRYPQEGTFRNTRRRR